MIFLYFWEFRELERGKFELSAFRLRINQADAVSFALLQLDVKKLDPGQGITLRREDRSRTAWKGSVQNVPQGFSARPSTMGWVFAG